MSGVGVAGDASGEGGMGSVGSPNGSISVLATLDEAYLPRLETMLVSLAASNPDGCFRVYLLHRGIPEARLARLVHNAAKLRCEVVPRAVDGALFADAPVQKRYPQEMYYRLLAAELLPDVEGRLLYLDPDILVINPVRPLWEVDLEGRAFAAAAHDARPIATLTTSVNRARLDAEGERYFNSGVLLLDMRAARLAVRAADVFACVRERGATFILPDQDVLNALYSGLIREVDELVWNYDARAFRAYYVATAGAADADWVMRNTAILHFCGRVKPWKPNYPYRFGTLYKHYQSLAERVFA